MDMLQQNVVDLIKHFRQRWFLMCESERTTVCGADDMLLILQLAVAEVNKRNGKEFTASLSDVLLLWKCLLKDKLDLLNETPAPSNYDDVRKTYNHFLENGNTLDIIDLHGKLSRITGLCTLSSEQLLEFLTGCPLEDHDSSLTLALTPCKKNVDFIKRKEVLKRIFCSYLNLLVNSKNDIALAQILNCPDRGLGREAFTELKRAAKSKRTSLYLVATSFIRTLELGGKGYAPSESDPLRKHLKGLSRFVNFMDKLNEILGIAQDARTAGEKLLSAIKMNMIKGRGSGNPFTEAVLEVAQDLDRRIKYLINMPSEENIGGSAGISPARPRTHAINRGTAICGRETIKILLILLDEEAGNPPSKNKAELCAQDDDTIFGSISLLSLFRSPEQLSGSSHKALGKRVQKCINKDKPKLKQNLIKSQFSFTYKEDSIAPHKLCEFPSMSQVPTCIHPAPKIMPVRCFDEEEITGVSKQKKAFHMKSGNVNPKYVKGLSSKESAGKSSKRKQVDENENQEDLQAEPPKKKVVAAPPKAKEKTVSSKSSSKGAPKNKLIAGQAKLTNFFRL